MALLDDELRSLYGVRPEGFVAARNELARALRKQGRRDDAADVAKLRRPSVSAWALNQVARDAPQLVTTLLDEGRRMRDAMQRAVQGDAVDVRPAQHSARRAVDTVVAEARRRLEQVGQSDNEQTVLRLNNTLRATSLDESLAERLRNGQLDADVVLSGFGFAGMTVDERALAPPPRAKAKRPVVAESTAEASGPEPDARKEAEEAARRAESKAAAQRLAATATRLASAAEKAQRQVEQLREQSARLNERLADAERAARLAAQAADDAHADAERVRRASTS